MKAVVAAFNQEKALIGAFSVITNLRMELFEALVYTPRLTHKSGKKKKDIKQRPFNSSFTAAEAGQEQNLQPDPA